MVINTDPSTQQHTIVVVCIVSPIVSSLFVAIRVWTRTFVTHSVGWDDYIALVTLPFCIACSVLVGLGTNYGFGWHFADISPSSYIFYNEWIYISSIIYLFTLGLYKFTILLLYLRLFGVNKQFRYPTWIVMFFVFGYLFSNLLTLAFGCTPIDKFWKSTTPGHCIAGTYFSELILSFGIENSRKTCFENNCTFPLPEIPVSNNADSKIRAGTKAGVAYGSMNFISDLVIFVLPLPMVWRLQLSRQNKLGVTLVFMGGVMASVVALVRYAFLLRRYFATDITWYDGKNLLWMVLEVNTGLICSCTLAFKPFFKHLASKGNFKNISPALTSHPKTSVPLGGRSDTGPLGQNTGDRGFMVLGDDETEMSVSHTGALEVEHDV